MMNIDDIICELNIISKDISSRKISLLNNRFESINKNKEISYLDDMQKSRVTELFYCNSIYNQEQAVDFFYNNKIFFYGDDPTDYGYVNQMFLYDIDEIEKTNISILRKSKTFDWITVGVKHFHGVYDFDTSEKCGAQSISNDKVVYYDDAEEMFDQVSQLIGKHDSK